MRYTEMPFTQFYIYARFVAAACQLPAATKWNTTEYKFERVLGVDIDWNEAACVCVRCEPEYPPNHPVNASG